MLGSTVWEAYSRQNKKVGADRKQSKKCLVLISSQHLRDHLTDNTVDPNITRNPSVV